jgi:hypothetical protein
MREELRLRVFENRVLRRIFRRRREEVIGEWSKLHNEELNGLHFSRNIVRVVKSRKMRTGQVVRMGDRRGVYRVFFGGETEGKKPLGRPRRRWEDNIKIDLQEMGCVGMDWIDLAQERDR